MNIDVNLFLSRFAREWRVERNMVLRKICGVALLSLPRGQGAELARRVGVYGCYITIEAILEPQYR